MLFAAAQATQNPICFSLIPELFPRERNTAMSLYNSAIYIGRAFSFGAVIIASSLGVPNSVTDPIGVFLVGLTLGRMAERRDGSLSEVQLALHVHACTCLISRRVCLLCSG